MSSPPFPPLQPQESSTRAYRHELRTLTYVTLDGANGGIVRNLSHEGVAVQAVGRLHPAQRVRLRFELRFPKLRIEAHGRVTWSSPAGQSGIRFVDLPPRTSHLIDEWIFSNLLDSLGWENANRSIFDHDASHAVPQMAPPKRDVPSVFAPADPAPAIAQAASNLPREIEVAWWSPLSPRTLAWMVDSLVLVAGLLIFALIFIAVAHELPQWQLTLAAGLAAAALVAAGYWALFAFFGGPSLGARLAEATLPQDKAGMLERQIKRR